MSAENLSLLSVQDVCQITGFSRQAIWQMERRGEFPSRIKLSTRKVGFLKQEIDDWIKERISARDLQREQSEKIKEGLFDE